MTPRWSACKDSFPFDHLTLWQADAVELHRQTMPDNVVFSSKMAAFIGCTVAQLEKHWKMHPRQQQGAA